jgi:CubicO group peptidase (beta-lactamase class C family)
MPTYRNSDTPLPIMQGSPPRLILPNIDWDRPPWNRWAFQHVREIVPTAEVWRGRGLVRPIPRDDRDLDGLPLALSDGSPGTLAQFLDETYTDGFIVLKSGRIVYERYFNAMDDRTLHLSQSVGKSITAATAGVLVGRGLLHPEAPVTDYLSELQATGWRDATLQQVLDMTTGVRFSEDYTDPYSDIGRLDVADGWKPIPPNTDPQFRWPHHMWELIETLTETVRPHGALFVYRSIETDVLAFAMERVTGKRLPQIVSEELWQKLGVEESANFTVDPAGYALADGGFNATLRDYARFGQLHLDNGKVDGVEILPASWIEATRNGDHTLFREPYTLSLPEGAYRNQFWIEDPRSRSVMARGVFGQLIYVNWDHQLVAVKLSSWPDFLNVAYNVATLRAIHAIAAAV